jgi:hypothetical protein
VSVLGEQNESESEIEIEREKEIWERVSEREYE